MAGAGAGTGGASGMPMGMGTLGGKLAYTDELTKGKVVPAKHKCPMPIGGGMGENKSPALAWTGGPAETKSFALIIYDTKYSVFHWGLWDIPATANKLPEGIMPGFNVTDPAGAHQFTGASMAGDKHSYFGPCSNGTGAIVGSYDFRLYALNKEKLELTESSNAMQVQSAITGAMLEMVSWTGMPE